MATLQKADSITTNVEPEQRQCSSGTCCWLRVDSCPHPQLHMTNLTAAESKKRVPGVTLPHPEGKRDSSTMSSERCKRRRTAYEGH